MLKYSFIIAAALLIGFSSGYSQYQLKFVDPCSNGKTAGIIYIRDSSETNYGFGFYSFCDLKMEMRNLIPPIRYIKTSADSVLIDSCDLYRPFVQWDSTVGYHKYLYEIQNPLNNDSTIALEYGDMLITNHLNPRDTSGTDSSLVKAVSYIIELAEEDEYADDFNPNEISQQHIFTDSNGNSLYELLYNSIVVGIKYYCSNNGENYERFFKGKD